jgi:hypothetical protein
MSKNLEKRLNELDAAAKEKLERDAMAIFEKYNNDPERLVKEASNYEKDVVWRWGEPQLEEKFKEYADMFLGFTLQIFLEHHIYPIILRGNKADEDKHTILAVDHLWMEVAYPDVWKRFIAEIKTWPSYDEDPEGFGKSCLSQGLVDEFKAVQYKLDLFKDSLRAKMAKEDEEDAKLCAEELAAEQAEKAACS